MRSEEAIRKLQKQKAEYLEEWIDYSGVAEAFDIAVSALQQPEIIRCKDCKWYDTAMPMTEGFSYCDKFGLVFGYNDFCSRAEKREG